MTNICASDTTQLDGFTDYGAEARVGSSGDSATGAEEWSGISGEVQCPGSTELNMSQGEVCGDIVAGSKTPLIGMDSNSLCVFLEHDNVLRLFQESNLRIELDTFARLADRLENRLSTIAATDACDSTALAQFLQDFEAKDRVDPSFARLTARMWPEHHRRALEADLNHLTLVVERRCIMLASVVAWQWLNNDCVNVIQHVVSHIEDPSQPASQKTWLSDLTAHVHRAVVNRAPISLEAEDFLPELSNLPNTVNITPRHTHSTSIAAAVCHHVLIVIRKWLNFPSNTECIAASFILHVLHTFHHNPDILLLHGLWKPYRSIKASVLGCPSWKKHTALRISMLDNFVGALRTLPLADASSEAAQLLSKITDAVHRCDPTLQAVTSGLIQFILPPSLPARDHRTKTLLAQTGLAPNPTVGLSGGPHEKGLHALKEFVLELVPLVCAETPSVIWTPLQALVRGDKDRLLPFREHAPSRQRVTSIEGPFHPLNISKAGAFPSALIFRGLLFTSTVIKFHTHGFFEDINDWQLFLDLKGYDQTDKQISGQFFVERAYGTPQHGRTLNPRTYSNVYFEKEPEWLELLAAYPDTPVPFMDFFTWTQQKTGWFDDEGKYHRGVRFPLIGPLAGYLLAADMSYTGVVAAPSVEEVGRVIRKNGLGSLSGMVSLNLVSGKKDSVANVVRATEQIYGVLMDAMSAEVREAIRFDAITVEHVLCKYGRCMRELGA